MTAGAKVIATGWRLAGEQDELTEDLSVGELREWIQNALVCPQITGMWIMPPPGVEIHHLLDEVARGNLTGRTIADHGFCLEGALKKFSFSFD